MNGNGRASLRVLHLVAGAGGRGAEMFAADLSTQLERCGLEQIVVSIHGGSEGQAPFRVSRATLRSSRLALPGVRIDLAKVRQLTGIADRWRPDVVQLHGGEALKYTPAFPARVPVVYRRIGMAPRWLRRGPRRTAYAMLMHRADRIVAVANIVGREIVDRFGVPAWRVVDIPNGVDVDRVRPTSSPDAVRRALGIGSAAPVVLWAGALTWEKDPFTALRVMASAAERVPGSVHVVVGDGPLRSDVDRFVADASLNDQIRVLGWRSDIADLLAATEVLLFTSANDGMEGMPAVLIEAGMSGLPVAGVRVAGVDEVVLEGRTGLLAEPAARDRLEDHVVRLLSSPPLRRRMGDLARERCLSRFGIERIAAMYHDTYRELVPC